MTANPSIHVVVGVVFNSAGQVLVALRPAHKHMGGLWEFPGGKIETGETPEEALKRELFEEVGIEVQQAYPLLKYDYDYPQQTVSLDVWQVNQFAGEAQGREGQQINWISPKDLLNLPIPIANQTIVQTVIKKLLS